MSRKRERFVKCVYLIGFKGHHKVYIGSTIRWPYRGREHLKDLADGVHHNRYLQRAYVKYGSSTVYIKVLETFDCTEDELRYREEQWIQRYDSANRAKGFNSVPFPSFIGTGGYIATQEQRDRLSRIQKERFSSLAARNEHARAIERSRIAHPERYVNSPSNPVTYTLFNPKGRKVAITNLYRYCREHELDYSAMVDVAKNIRIEYRGWKKTLDRQHRRKNAYRLIAPDGVLVEGVSIRKFCLDRDLSYRTMCALVRGEVKTCNGYRRADMDERAAKTYRGKDYVFISPDGQEVKANNGKAFCREHDLSYETLRKGYPSKGWRRKDRIT